MKKTTNAEDQLRKRIPGYKKSKYDALSLVKKIDTALLNQKYFWLESLKYSLCLILF